MDSSYQSARSSRKTGVIGNPMCKKLFAAVVAYKMVRYISEASSKELYPHQLEVGAQFKKMRMPIEGMEANAAAANPKRWAAETIGIAARCIT